MQFPDYSNSATNLMASILKHFDLEASHNSISEVDRLFSEGSYRNIVLMLFDGLSISTLADHLTLDSFLRRQLMLPLSAVFPSTTTAATTSMITGLNPGEHAWIGWTLYFREINKSIDIFLNTKQFSREAAEDYHVAKTFFPYTTITDRITQAGKAKGVVISPFDGLIIKKLNQLFLETKKCLKEDGRHYIYVYWPEPDKQMHQYGCQHEYVHQTVLNIENGLAELQLSLGPDDIILLTADHGLIDSKPDFFEDHPFLENMLRLPPSVEPRAAALYVKQTDLNSFPALFKEAFKDHYVLFTKEEALESGLFGPGNYHERLESLIGDFFAVATKDFALYQKHEHCNLIGMHAGLTTREMNVPLIVIKKKKLIELDL